MGRKIRAAKASLVAAFVAAGGAATAKSVSAASAAEPSAPVASQVNWGDQLVRFLKLDGFPAYFKVDEFAQLAQFYKASLLSDASALYYKYPDQVSALLDLYQKADAGPLSGILIGLETYWKADDIQPLLDYLKTPGALDA